MIPTAIISDKLNKNFSKSDPTIARLQQDKYDVPNPAVEYKIELNKAVYHGNDNVNGSIIIKSKAAGVLHLLRLAVVCRLELKEQSFSKKCIGGSETIYSSVKVVARDYKAVVGTTNIPFSFALPSDVPVSVSIAFCRIIWDVRILGEERVYGSPVYAFREFLMSVVYSSIDSTRRFVLGDGTSKFRRRLHVEASLSRDIYSEGEPVDVNLNLHRLKNSICVKSVNATIVQHVELVEAIHEGATATERINTIQQAEFLPCHWGEWTKVESGGCALSLRFSLLAQLPDMIDTDGLALQTIKDEENHLSPSIHLVADDCSVGLSVSYSLKIKISIRCGKDIQLSVPFGLQGNKFGSVSVSPASTCTLNSSINSVASGNPHASNTTETTRTLADLLSTSFDALFTSKSKPDTSSKPSRRRSGSYGQIDRPLRKTPLPRKFFPSSRAPSHDIIDEEGNSHKDNMVKRANTKESHVPVASY
eukprot:CFRG4197T1